MGTHKSVPQIRRPVNLRETETIVTAKFRGLHYYIKICQFLKGDVILKIPSTVY